MSPLADFFKGSRKFTFIILLLLISTIFRCFSLLTSNDFANLLSATGVAFMGSNAVEHVLNTAKEWLATKVAQPPEEKE